ncbi:hypothetical protein AB0D98_28035 [Streptomyces sp. NPDC047987]|uniref:hypothetical protein n=1 Tax=unclassified Streptomyces TaxID=2593676 RepID=UPI0034268A00
MRSTLIQMSAPATAVPHTSLLWEDKVRAVRRERGQTPAAPQHTVSLHRAAR